jgi:hypothetical protein
LRYFSLSVNKKTALLKRNQQTDACLQASQVNFHVDILGLDLDLVETGAEIKGKMAIHFKFKSGFQ